MRLLCKMFGHKFEITGWITLENPPEEPGVTHRYPSHRECLRCEIKQDRYDYKKQWEDFVDQKEHPEDAGHIGEWE